MGYPYLQEWWESGQGSNAWTTFWTRTGEAEVYVRRNIADRSVMEIANISTRRGHGNARALYRTYTRDIPAIAELVHNPELDALLVRWGWSHAYRDQLDIPTRINPAFMRRFPAYREANSVIQAIVRSRTG